ncbi:thiamine pyrophosphate-dependent enzyme [Candidatus Villigracilis saccharophilus]|uniref:thiamine pyrophosphate-dependent enzyme n=1 Tax=Candidatus Villigracilis saccharophilus TaxID=3140684 RepID=UPI0031E9A471
MLFLQSFSGANNEERTTIRSVSPNGFDPPSRRTRRGAYLAGKIGGFMHLYIGQEAVSTGLIAAREERDRVITAYRDHGVALNCGISANEVMAELLGKATGMSKGKGGSMHMADTSRICGADMPLWAASPHRFRASRSAINTLAMTISPSVCLVMARPTSVTSMKP